MYTTIKRCFFVALSLVIQILFNVYIMLYFYKNITLVQFVVLLLSVIIVLNIVKNSKNLNNDYNSYNPCIWYFNIHINR